jgi:hypothetical protein
MSKFQFNNREHKPVHIAVDHFNLGVDRFIELLQEAKAKAIREGALTTPGVGVFDSEVNVSYYVAKTEEEKEHERMREAEARGREYKRYLELKQKFEPTPNDDE